MGAQPKQPSVFELIGRAKNRLAQVKYKVMVLSGKGGVGKTFISSMLALALADMGYKVGIFDADIHGSSIPLIYGMYGSRIYANEDGIIPATGPMNVRVVATNLMLESMETPIVWRGPLKSRAIIELLANIKWGDLDYLIIDMPPGTGDEAITIAQVITDISGAIIVTAPSILSEKIVEKAINFVVANRIPLLGIVENMSYFKCPGCGKTYYILGRGTGEELARKYKTRLLARIPLDPYIGEAIDRGVPYLIMYPDADAARELRGLAKKIDEIIRGKS